MTGAKEELEQTRKERDTARRVAEEAMRHLTDDQLAQVRESLDEQGKVRDEPDSAQCSP